jgi:hypothetical protein
MGFIDILLPERGLPSLPIGIQVNLMSSVTEFHNFWLFVLINTGIFDGLINFLGFR